MKNVNHYFSIRTVQTSNCLEFNSMNEFCQFTKSHQLPDIFLLLNGNNEPEHFGIIHNHVLFRHATLGFKTLEDYSSAEQHKFPNAEVYYEATRLGYQSYEDFVLVKEAGISCKDTFGKMKQLNFITGFREHQERAATGADLPELPSFANPFELYRYATDNGFADYQHFSAAIVAGFAEAANYRMATDAGFLNRSDYEEARQRGFANHSEWVLAKENNIRDAADYQHFTNLQTLTCDDCSHDQKVLLSLISKIEPGKKVSINKLKEIFKNATDTYRYADTGELPSWFSFSLCNDESLIGFLSKNERVKKFGAYDMDGEFFEINPMKQRSVIIDGSNVAHNSGSGNAGSKPYIANIIQLVEYLKKEGFADISIIVDASLKHRLQDLHKLPQLKQMAEYLEAPRETSADTFLIQYIKKNHCLLVSNDTFREWKVRDTWTAENIDYYRLSFMIKGNQVLLPDL